MSVAAAYAEERTIRHLNEGAWVGATDGQSLSSLQELQLSLQSGDGSGPDPSPEGHTSITQPVFFKTNLARFSVKKQETG